MPLYQDIASDLSSQISSGIYLSGERLPSLRVMAKQLKVSISSVLEAYSLLEQQDMVETRPQSGYYVCHRQRLLASPPESRSLQPAQLRLGKTINEILSNNRNDKNFNFGLAIPHQQLLPEKTLAKLSQQILRKDPAAISGAAFSPGLFELRQQIAKFMLRSGCQAAPEQIMITNGCQESVLLALQTVTKAGDIVAVESPCYHGFLLALESLGLKVVTIASHAEQGMDLNALEDAAKQWPIKACIVTPTFSNPSGACMSDASKQQLVQLAKYHNMQLIEDDIMGELSFSHDRPKPLLAFDKNDQVIYCSSFSKTIAPGLRIGWLVSANRQQQLIERQMTTTTGANRLAQRITAEYLKGGYHDKQLKQSRMLYQHNQQRAIQVIAKHFPSGTQATQPDGGFTLWLALDKKINSFELYQLALAEKISIVPGKLFARSGFNNYLRLNYARPWDKKVERKLARVGELATILLNQS